MSTRDEMMEPLDSGQLDGVKRAAMGHVERAFEDAEADGLPPDAVAHAALFASISALVGIFGEDTVAELAKELPEKIAGGSFTIGRTLQ
jgi:hypothetical protein